MCLIGTPLLRSPKTQEAASAAWQRLWNGASRRMHDKRCSGQRTFDIVSSVSASPSITHPVADTPTSTHAVADRFNFKLLQRQLASRRTIEPCLRAVTGGIVSVLPFVAAT